MLRTAQGVCFSHEGIWGIGFKVRSLLGVKKNILRGRKEFFLWKKYFSRNRVE